MEPVRSSASVGALVRAARLRLGWSQQRAAEAAGVSRRFVNLVEGGEHHNAELWRVLALLEALGVQLVASVDTAPAAHATQSRLSLATATPVAFDLDRYLAGFRAGDGS